MLFQNMRKGRTLPLVILFALLLQTALLPLATPVQASTPIDGLTIIKTADKTNVNVNDEFSYFINVALASTVALAKDLRIEDVVPAPFIIQGVTGAGATGNTVSINRQMSPGDSLEIEIKVKVGNTYTNSLVTKTNTATATEISNGNVSSSNVNVSIAADATPAPTAPPTATPTPTQSTYDKWAAFKTQESGFTGTVLNVGGDISYKVGIKSVQKSNTLPAGALKNITLVDTYPANATVTLADIQHSAGPNVTPVINTTNRTITWSNFDLASGQSFEALVTLKFSDSLGWLGPINQTNQVDITQYTIEGPPETEVTLEHAEVITKFGRPVSGGGAINKNRTFDYRWHGQEQTYTIGGITNTATGVNSELRNLVLTDTLPTELTYTQLKMPNRQWTSFTYVLKNGGSNTFTPNSNGNAIEKAATGSNLSIGPAGNIIVPVGDSLVSVSWTFASLPINQTIGGIEIKGSVLDTATGPRSSENAACGTVTPNADPNVEQGDTIKNCAVITYDALTETSPGAWGYAPKTPGKAVANFLINEPKPWLNAWKDSQPNNAFYGPLSTVPFTIHIRNKVDATGPWVNPVIYDLLPQDFNYYTNPKQLDLQTALAESFTITGLPSGAVAPELEILPDLNGKTLVKWSWPSGISLDPGTQLNITYNGQIRAGALATGGAVIYVNNLYAAPADPTTQFWHDQNSNPFDPSDFPGWAADNAGRSETALGFEIPPTGPDVRYYVNASAPVVVSSAAVVKSTKWNKGDLAPVFDAANSGGYSGPPSISFTPFDRVEGDSEYTEFPRFSSTYEGGSADYKLVIQNSGNTRLSKIDAIDILPFIGDQSVLGNTARGSEWRPNLASTPISGTGKTFTYVPEGGGPSKTITYDLNVYYSLSADKGTIVNFSNAVGSKNGWINQASFTSDDLTDIQSLYFEFKNIKGSDGSNDLAPGDYIVLGWDMNAPVGTETGKVAWNSFAIQATSAASGRTMLPAEPNKVGFLVHPTNQHVPLGEIGNFVWFDSNRNGIQDEEYPGDSGQGAGINGIQVNLYKDGGTTPYKETITGYHQNGSPGYYLFQGLPTGQYEVEFVLPERYSPTTANTPGADPTHVDNTDSNKVTKLATIGTYTPYRTDSITIDVLTADKIKNFTIDLGLVEGGSGVPSFPSAEFVKSITNVAKGSSTDAPSISHVVVGNEVQYEIEFTNTSTVTLHNIKISDTLDRNQAGFAFNSLTYDGSAIPINGNSHSRSDIISSISNSGTEPYIVIKKLAPNKKIVLTGTYSVTSDDFDLSELDNKATVYYNESEDPLEDTASIPTAGVEVVKTSSRTSASSADAGDWIDYLVTVSNTGSSTLTNIVITDTKVTGIPNIPSLEAGKSIEITYPYQLTSTDVSGATIVNTVNADPAETPPVSDTHIITVTTDPRGSIGDYVWFDLNENGIQDASENGLNGITVKLLDDNKNVIATTLTRDKDGKAGHYSFKGLPFATYYVQFIVPGDYDVTAPNKGTSSTDSNAIDASGVTDAIVLTALAPDDLTIDLGLYPRGEIGNYVWLDRNRDGVQNEQEKDGINGIVVKLFKDNVNGTEIATTTTANDSSGKPGYYLFDHLLSGNYFVQFVIPNDYNKTVEGSVPGSGTDSNVTDNNGITQQIVIGEATRWVDHTIDLGLVGKGSIGNYVWVDRNDNGKQDEEEKDGVNGIKVNLYDNNKILLEETVTGNDSSGNPGYYLFEHLVGGDYYVEFEVPSIFGLAKAAAAGTTTATDSNPTVNGMTQVIQIGATAPAGWSDMTIDLGLVGKGSIGDYVWHDRNRDGIQNEKDSDGINGVVVKLYKGSATGTPVAQTTTANDSSGKPGYYKFTELLEGDYYVQFVLPVDYEKTAAERGGNNGTDSNSTNNTHTTAKIEIGEAAGWIDPTIDLGLIAKGEIGNYVWLDRNRDGVQNENDAQGINGITVKLYKDTVTGTPYEETTTYTGPDGKPGYYLFDNLREGDYFVQFIYPTDYEKTVPGAGTDSALDSNPTDTSGVTSVITIGHTEGWVNHTIDLGLIAKGKIGNYVWYDINSNGKQDDDAEHGFNYVVVKLYDKDKGFLEQTKTANDSNGNPGYYLFDQLLNGQYYVEFTIPAGFVVTQAEATGVSAELDSNKLTHGLTEAIYIGDSAPFGWENLSIDLGLYNAPVPPVLPSVIPPVQPPVQPPVLPPVNPDPEVPVVPVNPPVEHEATEQDKPIKGHVDIPVDSKPSIGEKPSHGTVTIDDKGNWVYTPNPGYTGKDKFSIIVKDKDGNEEEIFFEIDVEVPQGGIDNGNTITPPVSNLPKTGEQSYLLMQILGLSLLLLGVALQFRRKKS
ncbi:SdrD B-like domain-containing protein [Paenibacillus sinopodophylli]|uniref:SdrD B-like domain-containing protein n=1 Tax=Paenibacillus sinopodophylli TaxID=1837342 RepID=UPI001485F290|nr:SdrD B-like domain-containing protein [Paenibacillus sinopodophylli]